MKVLLIVPPFYRIIGMYNRYFPFGVTSIGTYLKASGHEALIYDADYNERPIDMNFAHLSEKYRMYLDSIKDKDNHIWREVRQTITDSNPDLIGISIWTTFAASAFHAAQIAKDVYPDCPVVMGGSHASVKADEILKISPHVDCVVRGEGEFALKELADHAACGKPALSSILGLSYREGGDIRHNPPRAAVKDLDVFGFPDRSLLMNESRYSSEDMGLIMTSRGCPFACTYCSTDRGRVSFRSIDNIMDEIRLVRERYGTKMFSIKDDSFTVRKKRVEEFCDRLISEGTGINWECNTRVNLIDEGLLMKMKKAGCNSIKVGVESGSERVLKSMNKGITLDHVRNAAALFRKAGIFWTGYFMMGVPGETVEDVRKTLDFIYEVRPDYASVSVYEPFPGTPMFEEGLKKGLNIPEMVLDDFFTMLPDEYYVKMPRQHVDTIDENVFWELEKEMRDAVNVYNRSFRRMLKRASSRVDLYVKEPTTLLGDIKKYRMWK